MRIPNLGIVFLCIAAPLILFAAVSETGPRPSTAELWPFFVCFGFIGVLTLVGRAATAAEKSLELIQAFDRERSKPSPSERSQGDIARGNAKRNRPSPRNL